MTNLPEKIYSESQVERAKTTAQVVGWLQGAGAVIGVGLLFKLLGWIPVLLGVGAAGWLVYRLFGGKGKPEDEA